MNIVIVDLETSGVDPTRHSILSIGAYDPASGSEFYCECRAWDGAEIDQGALAVNGFTVNQIHDSKRMSEADAVGLFLAWLRPERRALLGGMNPRMDRDFVTAAAERAGLKSPFTFRTLDLHSLAVAHALRMGHDVPDAGYHTDAIYELLGMEAEPRPHNALTGALHEYRAFYRLLFEQTPQTYASIE